jgi:hypothetical protein
MSDFDSGSLDLRARKGNRFVLLRQSLVGIVAAGQRWFAYRWLVVVVFGACRWRRGRAVVVVGLGLPATKEQYDESADDHKTSFVLGAISYCNSVSPGFTTFNPTAQAPCLCYSSTSWAPGLFDGVAVTCANYISTAVSSDYSIF